MGLKEAAKKGPTVPHIRFVAYLRPCGRFIEIQSNPRRKKLLCAAEVAETKTSSSSSSSLSWVEMKLTSWWASL